MKQIYKQLKTVVTVMLFCIAPTLLWAQTKISGTVTDDTHQPLPGVNVKVTGTNKGGVTDINGRYLISASKGQSLTFTFIGFEPQTVVVGDDAVIDINLK